MRFARGVTALLVAFFSQCATERRRQSAQIHFLLRRLKSTKPPTDCRFHDQRDEEKRDDDAQCEGFERRHALLRFEFESDFPRRIVVRRRVNLSAEPERPAADMNDDAVFADERGVLRELGVRLRVDLVRGGEAFERRHETL